MKSTITAIIVVLVSFFILPTQNVFAAEEVKWCASGTGTDAVPCQPCVPGPYKICVPDTGLIEFIQTGDVSELGPVDIAGVSLLGLGVLLLINSRLIKKFI